MATPPPTFPGTTLDALGLESAGKAVGDGVAKSLLFQAQTAEQDKAQAGLAVRLFAGMLNALAKLPAGVIVTADEIEKEAGPAMLEIATAAIADVFGVQLAPSAFGAKGLTANAKGAGDLIGEAALAAVFANLKADAATNPAAGEENARKVVQLLAAEEMGQFVTSFFKGVIEHYVMAIPEAGDVLLKLTGLDAQARGVFGEIFDVLMRDPWRQQLLRTYQPRLLTPRQLVRALSRRAIEELDFFEQMARQGYSEARARALIVEESEKLTVGDIKALYRSARWDSADVGQALVQVGYTPELAELLTFAITNEQIPALTAAGGREALELYEAGDVGESELRSLLDAMHWTAGEIETGIALALVRRQKTAQLSLAAVEDAYTHGDISLGDLRDHYERKGYRVEDVGILERRAVRRRVEEEEREREREERDKAHTERRPALSTMERGFIAGLVDAETLRAYYLDLGFVQAAADLQLQLATRRRDEALKREEAKRLREEARLARRLPVAALREAYVRGLVGRDVVAELLAALGYVAGDVEAYLAVADQLQAEREEAERRRAAREAPAPPRAPSVADAEEGFYAGLWSLDRLGDYYSAQGFSDEARALLLGLAQREKDERDRERQEEERRRALGAARRPSRSDFERAFRAGLMTTAALLAEYRRLGYSDADAALLLELATPAPAAAGPG